MNNFKKVGLTALAGSLAAVSAHAAEIEKQDIVKNKENNPEYKLPGKNF